MDAIQRKRLDAAVSLNPCQQNMAILSQILGMAVNEIMHKDFQSVSAFSQIFRQKRVNRRYTLAIYFL